MFQMAIQPKLMEIRHLDAEGQHCYLNIFIYKIQLYDLWGKWRFLNKDTDESTSISDEIKEPEFSKHLECILRIL